MSAAKKFREGWDFASYLMRTDKEHERRPRPEPDPEFELPASGEFDMNKCLAVWLSIGFINNPKWIAESMERIERWQRRGAKFK